MQKKLRLYYWIVMAFLEKYLLYISISFFITSFAIAMYVLFSKDILRFFDTQKVIIGYAGKVTLNKLPEEVINDVTVHMFTKDKESGEFRSEIFDKWSNNKNFTVYTLSLKNNLTFTDNSPFTSKDIQIEFKDVRIDRPDDQTIIFTLPKPFPQFLSYLTIPIYSTAPFRGVKGSYIVTGVLYTKNQDSISEIILSPLTVDKVEKIFRIYPNENDLANAYKLREIDRFSTTSKAAFEDFQKWPNTMSIKTADYTRLTTLFFNQNHTFLKEKDVRAAILGSIPIAKLEEAGSLAVSPISPLSDYYDPSIPRIPENPELDRNILIKYFKQASESAKFRLSTSFQFLNLAHIIQEIIQGAGGTCTVDINGLQQGEQADMVLGLWDIPNEVNQYFIWHSSQKGGTNITNYDNQRVDKLLEDFRATDSATLQKKLMIDFQKRIAEDIPAAFLYYPSVYTIQRK
ncbi:MAG: ABC transporter substrate-binding protein [Patescibacteria group bacterium]